MTRLSTCTDQNRNQDFAGILPLFAILIVPLIGIVGLAIDSSLAASARAELATKTNQTALAAMAQYTAYIRLPDKTPADAAQQAVARARGVANVNFTIGERFSASGSNDKINLGNIPDITPSQQNMLDIEGEGEIQLGRYYWSKPCQLDESGQPIGDSLPCPASCGNLDSDYPCFAPAAIGAADNNAIKVRLQFKETNLIRSLFIKILGIKEFGLAAESIATLIPRNDYFLIDLSQSVTWDTYLPHGFKRSEPTDACPQTDLESPTWNINRSCSEWHSRSRFTFLLKHASSDPNFTPHPFLEAQCELHPGEITDIDGFWDGLHGSQSLCYDANSCGQNLEDGGEGKVLGNYETDYTGLALFRANQSHLIHFPHNFWHVKDELRCRKLCGVDAHDDDCSDPFYLLVDHQVSSFYGDPDTSFYTLSPPQPLFDILASAFTGMDILKNRNMSADNFGLRGFDRVFDEGYYATTQGQPSKRHLPLQPVDLTDGSPFLEYHQALNREYFSNPANQLLGTDFISKGFIPIGSRSTDLHRSIQLAMNEIASPNNNSYQQATNSIFIFTDGMANCRYAVVEGQEEQWELQNCQDSGTNIVNTLQNFAPISAGGSGLVEALISRRIAVSVALVGGGSGAHYIARKSKYGAGCANLIEAGEESSFPFVDPSIADPDDPNNQYQFPYSGVANGIVNSASSNSRRGGAPFYAANILFDYLVKPTKGIWIPILPQLLDSDGNVIVFDEELEGACNGLTAPENPNDPTPIVTNVPLVIPNPVDSNGRLLYDPYGRPPGLQLEQGMRLVLSSPFVLAPTGPAGN